MFDVKQSQRVRVPVRLFAAGTGAPEAGVAAASVSVSMYKADGTVESYTADPADWAEASTGAAAGSGLYQLNLLETDTDVVGPLIYVATTGTSEAFVGSIKVSTYVEDDIYPVVSDLNTAVGLLSIKTGYLFGAAQQNTAVCIGKEAKISVQLWAENGSPVTGVAAADVTVAAVRMDGSVNTYTPPGGEWVEVTDEGALGLYRLTINGFDAILPGLMVHLISTPDAQLAIIRSQVIESDIDDVAGLANDLHTMATGRWKIFTSGPDANKLVLYQPDGTTPLRTFDLKDEDGAPSYTSVFERVPA